MGHATLALLPQDEVDTLTRRSRAAEKAFVSFYRELYVVPDPTSTILAALNDGTQAVAGAVAVCRSPLVGWFIPLRVCDLPPWTAHQIERLQEEKAALEADVAELEGELSKLNVRVCRLLFGRLL